NPRPRRFAFALWTVLFILSAAIIVRFAGAAAGIKWLWFALVALMVACRWLFSFNEHQARHLSLGLLAAILVYFGVLTLLQHAALNKASARAQSIAREQVADINALALPVNPLSWLTIVTTDQAFYLTEINSLGATPSLNSAQRIVREMGDPAAILAARGTA